MALVMAVSFERYGRLHYLDPGERPYATGDWVLVPTEAGPEVARCVWPPTEVADWTAPLARCPGPASADDLQRDAANRRRRAEILEVATTLIARHELAMRVVAVDYVDRSDDFDHQSVIYFEAPRRVDFRALLGDLARTLRSRIDLRQVGARDAAALVGGIGACGLDLCCTTIGLPTDPISLRMAKTQDLPANPLQIAGVCGRLLCCLAYEQPSYVEFLQLAPAVGSHVSTPQGDGVVTGHSVPTDSVLVRTAEGPIRCPRADACPRPAHKVRTPAAG